MIVLYKTLYQAGRKLSKGDKLGLHRTVEESCLGILTEIETASLQKLEEKIPHLERVRIKIAILKQLIGLENQLALIDDKTFWDWQEKLAEISKGVGGWLKYLKQKALERASAFRRNF